MFKLAIMNNAIISLGGNFNETPSIFINIIDCFNNDFSEVMKFSSVYKSSPWGFKHENDFFNQILILNTKLSSIELLNYCLKKELDFGRKRTSKKYSERNIDIDIIYYNDLIFNSERLILPHPRIHLRKFVLLPLVEVLPNYIHPVLKKTNKELLFLCSDQGKVTKL